MMDTFYVYMYLDPQGVPFYIGKGKGERHRISQHIQKFSSNLLLKRKILKIGIDNVITKKLYENLTEEHAFYLEEYYIAGYGRRDLGLGPLCNLTNGGDGQSGLVHSATSKQKMSDANKGKQSTLGYIHSEDTKRKIASSRTGCYLSNESREKVSVAQKLCWQKRKSIPGAN